VSLNNTHLLFCISGGSEVHNGSYSAKIKVLAGLHSFQGGFQGESILLPFPASGSSLPSMFKVILSLSYITSLYTALPDFFCHI
jgi:hypothetical protein